MTEREQLQQTIALLESQRAILGDAVVAAAIAPLRARLESLDQTRPSLHAERKFVTVMFADISGFTALSETLDPETIRDLMNTCFEQLVPVIKKYGGSVDKFIGDGIMALFGAPLAHENDPERALRTALEMMDSLREFNTSYQLNLGLHFGINTGLVVAGGLGTRERQEYSVMGDAVNVASRLEDASQRGEILVGPDTYRLTAPLFEFEALPPLSLKGKSEPLPAHRLIGLKTTPGSLRGITGLTSPLIGRQIPFNILNQAILDLQKGTGGIVTIVGEAGLGKSRLIAEVHQASQTNLTWLEGRCLSYGGTIAYLPWLDIIRALLGRTADDPIETVQQSLLAHIDTLGPEYREKIYPYLARLLSLPLDNESAARLKGINGETLQSGTFLAIETLIREMAHHKPLVIIGEDLHWADSTSLALLEQIFALTQEVPLLIIAILRPEREHGCWNLREIAATQYAACHHEAWLDPLSSTESDQLIGNLLQVEELPAELRERILRHTEGNPFYMEEIIRSLMDNGTIIYNTATGCWRATRLVEEIDLPDTLQGVLMSRIDRLQLETRHVLQLAAIIGRSFLYRVLAEIAREERHLTHHLNQLMDQQMIRERSRNPELEYIFKHQLTQEAAYHSLLKKERRQFHQQVAEVLERLFPDRTDELIGLLAHHWERAEDHERARFYLTRAGALAAAQFANTEAALYYSRALALIPEEQLAERYELTRIRERIYNLSGERASQLQDLNTMEALATALQSPERQSEVELRRANYAWIVGEYDSAITHSQQAIQIAEPLHDLERQAWGYFTWGRVLMYRSQQEEALIPCARALELAQACGSRLLEGWVLRNIGNNWGFQGYMVKAQPYVELALSIHRELGDRTGEAAALNTLALNSWEQGCPDEILPQLEQSLTIYRETGDSYGQGMVLLNLSSFYTQSEQFEKAQRCLEESQRAWSRTRDRAGVAENLTNQGWIAFYQRNYSRAAELFTRSTAQEKELNHLAGQAPGMLGNAEIAYACGRYSEARRIFAALQIINTELHDKFNYQLIQCRQTDLNRTLGICTEARSVLLAVLENARTRNSQRLKEIGLQTLARLTCQEGNYQEAHDYSLQALEIARRWNYPNWWRITQLWLGHALAGLGDEESALTAYQTVLKLSPPETTPLHQADALIGLARIALRRGEIEAAQARIAPLIPLLMADFPAGTQEPFRLYLTCYQILQTAGDPRATELLAQGRRRLLECAATLENENERRSFLEEVAAHRELNTTPD